MMCPAHDVHVTRTWFSDYQWFCMVLLFSWILWSRYSSTCNRGTLFTVIVFSCMFVVSVDGSTQASIPHYGVSESLLKEVAAWLEEGCTMKDVVVRLRQRTVPAGHSYHSWTVGNSDCMYMYMCKLYHECPWYPLYGLQYWDKLRFIHLCYSSYTIFQFWLLNTFVGKKEGHADMLRSILAQLEYTARVRQYSSQGVPFDKHMHVPEVHKCTGEVVCQREDEGHIFKVKHTCMYSINK